MGVCFRIFFSPRLLLKRASCALPNACLRPEADVLDFFFHFEPETVAHAVLEVIDHFPDLQRGALARVVDEVRVIVRDLDVAVSNAFRSDLFQKICRWDLSFAYDLRIIVALNGFGKVDEEQVLENAARAFHLGRVLGVADGENLIGLLAEGGGIALLARRQAEERMIHCLLFLKRLWR